MEWINIAKVGKWIDKNGKEVDLTLDRLKKIAESYNPKEREAPLVLGHPQTDTPAYGWTEALRISGEFLQAKFRKVVDALKEAVDRGHYEKVSMSLCPDDRLKHVGLLGAAQPAIPGLGNVSFEGEGEETVIDFAAGVRLENHQQSPPCGGVD